MATKRASSRPRKTTKKKKSKKSTGGLGHQIGIALKVLIFACVLGAGAWLYLATEDVPDGAIPVALESMLVAADLDLDEDLQKKTVDGVPVWRVRMQDNEKKKAVLRGLLRYVKRKGGRLEETSQKQLRGQLHHLVTISMPPDERMRILFVVGDQHEASESPKREPERKPKPRPKTEPVAQRQEQTKPPTTRAVAANEPVEQASREREPVMGRPEDPPPRTQSAPVAQRAGEARPRIAIIIDDVGHHPPSHLDNVLDMGFKVTWAILPYLKYSQENAISLHRQNHEIMLHMPMEPGNYPTNNPGEGALLSNFTEEQTVRAIERALNDFSFIEGVNNHMGSKATTARSVMRVAMREFKKRDLYFVDSRTNAETVAYDVARGMGLRTAERDVFIDAEESYDFAVKQLRETARVASEQGFAIAIGHPYPSTLKAMVDIMPQLDQQGYDFVFASALVKQDGQF